VLKSKDTIETELEELRRLVKKHQNSQDPKEVARLASEINTVADLAQLQRRLWARKACLTRAAFHERDRMADAMVGTYYILRLAKLDTAGLLEFAILAQAKRDVALASVVADELTGRVLKQTITAPECKEIQTVLDTVETEGEQILQLLQEYELLRRIILVKRNAN
jgi:hypothetical protein